MRTVPIQPSPTSPLSCQASGDAVPQTSAKVQTRGHSQEADGQGPQVRPEVGKVQRGHVQEGLLLPGWGEGEGEEDGGEGDEEDQES